MNSTIKLLTSTGLDSLQDSELSMFSESKTEVSGETISSQVEWFSFSAASCFSCFFNSFSSLSIKFWKKKYQQHFHQKLTEQICRHSYKYFWFMSTSIKWIYRCYVSMHSWYLFIYFFFFWKFTCNDLKMLPSKHVLLFVVERAEIEVTGFALQFICVILERKVS